MSEKRSAQRTQTFFKAQAIWPDAQQPMPCLVTDISQTGARLQPADEGNFDTLPDRFDLIVQRSGTRYQARVVWRRDGELGVAFA